MNNFRNNHIKVLLLISIFFIIFEFFSPFINPVYSKTVNSINESPIFQLNDGWQYQIGSSKIASNYLPNQVPNGIMYSNWKRFGLFDSMSCINKKNVWIQTKLPTKDFKEPCLLLFMYENKIKVYLDDNIIYNSGSNNNSSIYPFHVISLPNGYQEKTLTINIESNTFESISERLKKSQIGSNNDILNSINDQITSTLKYESIYIVISGLLLFLGILIIVSAFIKKNIKKSCAFLALSSICSGLLFLLFNNVAPFIINLSFITHNISNILSLIIPIGIYLFIENTFDGKYILLLNRFRKIYTLYCCFGYMAFSAIIFNRDLKFLNFLYSLLIIAYFLLLLITSSIAFICVVKSLNTKNNNSKMYLYGFSVLFLGCIFDMGYVHILQKAKILYGTAFCMFFFILTLLTIYLRQFNDTYETMEIFSKEIENKTEILANNQKYLDKIFEYDRLKTEFLANISHELRTPLNIFITTLQLVKDYWEKDIIKSDKNLDSYINTIQHNCYRQLRLINNLIDTSKIESGDLKPTMINCNIVKLVEDISISTINYIKSKELNIIFETEVKEKTIACDADKIERIILNLISNAAKFTTSGGTIKISIRELDNYLIIIVEDTGIGIPQDKLNLIFERFKQVENNISKSYEGSGIGLSLVKSLVNMHSGEISVESEYGKGSKFTVKLPDVVLKNQNNTPNLLFHSGISDTFSIELSDINSY